MQEKKPNFIRRYFIAGLFVWLPIWIVFAIIKFVIHLLGSTFSQLPERYQPEQIFGHHVPGLGIILTLLIILLTGLIASHVTGRYLINAWDRLLIRIPLIGNIYSAVKQMLQSFTHHKSESFRKVLLIEYPSKGIFTIGFQTSSATRVNNVEGELVSVFIPTTPLPTTGVIVFVRKTDAIELDISVEAAFKLIVSLGIVKPEGFGSTRAS